jgi:hypothetical protein
MEFQTLRFQALEKLKVADHLIDTTYSLVKEPKLLVSVIENIAQALELSITAVLEYERGLKTIISYENTFDGKIEMFRRKILTKYGLHGDILTFVQEVRKTLESHKKSSVEFTKKEKFVISDNDYNITTLTLIDVKKTLLQAKRYVNELLLIIKI